jgi:hypothetical protein
VQWRVFKECVDQALSLISKLSEEVQIVSLQARVLVEHRVVQSVHRLGEENNYFKLTGELKNSLLQRVHREEDPNNQRLFENFLQGVHAGTLLEALSLQVRDQKG